MKDESSRKNATQEQIAYLLKRTTGEIEIFIRKEGMPYVRRSHGQYLFDFAQAMHWYVDRCARLLIEEKERREKRSLPEIAFLFKKEPRWINRLTKEKGLPKDARGEYDLPKVIHWLVDEHEKELKEARRGGETEGQARKRLYAAQASSKEIELAKLRGEVLHREDVKLLLQAVLKGLRDKILGIPKRAAPQIVALQNIAEIEELLETFVTEFLDDLTTLPNTLERAGRLHLPRPSGGVPGHEAAAEAHYKSVGRHAARAKSGK